MQQPPPASLGADHALVVLSSADSFAQLGRWDAERGVLEVFSSPRRRAEDGGVAVPPPPRSSSYLASPRQLVTLTSEALELADLRAGTVRTVLLPLDKANVLPVVDWACAGSRVATCVARSRKPKTLQVLNHPRKSQNGGLSGVFMDSNMMCGRARAPRWLLCRRAAWCGCTR